MSIIMLVFTSMLSYQQKETKHLSEKLTVLELRNLLSSVLADGKVCTFELTNPVVTFDPTNASASISINQIHLTASSTAPIVAQVNQAASTSERSVVIQSISLKDFTGSGSSFLAHWEFAFDQSKLIRPLKPIIIPTVIAVENITSNSANIKTCSSAGSAGSCPTAVIEFSAEVAERPIPFRAR